MIKTERNGTYGMIENTTYTYNRSAGIVYFMMDTNHPDKFVFFSVGQDNFLGKPTTENGLTTTWNQTIRFTNN